MLEAIKTALLGQFEAALFTLRDCVTKCPRDLWFAPVGHDPYWYVVYHTLSAADFYLEADEAAFRPQPFHREDEELLGPRPWPSASPPGREVAYTPETMVGYVDHCRGKAAAAIGSETAATLTGPSGFARRKFSRLELYVYNTRHLQHHAAHLSLRLLQTAGAGVDWRGSGWPGT